MAIAESKITAQGQISVPAAIRELLGLAPGSVIEWEKDGDNIVVKRAAQYSSEDIHARIFDHSVKPHDIESYDEGIRKRMQKKYARR